MAFEAEGFRTIGFAEIDPYASAVLRKHWPGVPNYGDVRTVRTGCDVISAGFPCQPFSVAGRRLGKADNRNEWETLLTAIDCIRPAFVLGENVVGIESMVLAECLDGLASIGYRARAFDVPACAVGLPTLERHIWIVAAHTDDGLQGCASKSVQGEQISKLFGREVRPGASVSIERPDLPQSRLLRSRKGVPNYVERIKRIGNAINPQVAQVIARAIYQQLRP